MNDIQLYNKVSDLIQKARNSVVKQINHTMVYTYYEIGRMIVEEEQEGHERAEYGKSILKNLSDHLTKEFWKRFFFD